jgi:hypothetical protein
MQFTSLPQKRIYELIFPWIRELFGSFATPIPDIPLFNIVIGESIAQVGVYPWGEDDATITTRSLVVNHVDLSPGLLRYLLKENDKMRFGAFGLDSEDNILFEHTMAGSACNKDGLKGSILAVVITADQYSQQIIDRWGGERAVHQFAQLS